MIGIGVRYFYRTEGRRRVTVAYQHDQATGNTSYGASIFRKDWQGETFVKREHRQTAESRLNTCPVRIQLDLAVIAGVEQNKRQALVEDLIRQAIHVHGVRGERLINGGRIAMPDDLPEGVQVCIGLDPNWPGNEKYQPFPGEKPVAEESASSVELEQFAEELLGGLASLFKR